MEEKKKVNKVVTNAAKVKTNEVRKLTNTFISEDAKSVGSYIWMDVLVPTIKKAIVDIVTDGVNMIFFGGTGARRSGSSGSKVSYSNYYDRRDERRPIAESREDARFDRDDIEFKTRGDAEAVLDQMRNLIERYGTVSVADMYDMAELTPPYTSHRYGWTNLRTAEVVRTYNGYIIKLPKVMPLD